MAASWSGSVPCFLATPEADVLARLTHVQVRSFHTNRLEQLRAWTASIAVLQRCLPVLPNPAEWRLLLEYELLRLGRRIDAVLVGPRGILVLEFKDGADGLTQAGREQVEDYALDLRDFHLASRRHPIVPILVGTEARVRPQSLPLMHGVTSVVDASATSLPGMLTDLCGNLPAPAEPLDTAAWELAPYHPVPTIVEAARMLYDRNDVADLKAARADRANLGRTTDAILTAIQAAQTQGNKLVLFVTGIPGAGKTLCGLNAVFGTARAAGAVFLTGNPSLVHVLREALARDHARDRRGALRDARQRMESQIQALPFFRDGSIESGDVPPERVAVIDEAQRCWSRSHAIQKTRDRRVRLTDSEPGHLLDIMGRHQGWAAIVCLVGNGQEIHTGEGGLAEWGEALRARPWWLARAAPGVRQAADLMQRLPDLAGLHLDPALNLDVPIRSIRGPESAPWVDAVLAGDAPAARAITAVHDVPVLLTRDLGQLRATLRRLARGSRRAGLVASSGAQRLRAEGLGVELPHMDAGAVARWFLDRWPADVRASDALETVATEFSCQGLELDYVGLCWDGDFLPRHGGWTVRSFRGTDWQTVRAPAAITYRINTYRVLLTRARYETVIWVPRGSREDRTRNPGELDGVAAFLEACGARSLSAPAPSAIPNEAEFSLG
jgi:hypothetical protein